VHVDSPRVCVADELKLNSIGANKKLMQMSAIAGSNRLLIKRKLMLARYSYGLEMSIEDILFFCGKGDYLCVS
jgi:hypothetical protein